jgi:hypothetical protein
MIEQTETIVSKWHFHLLNSSNNVEHITNSTTIDVMQKRNAIKKGIACRLNCQFKNGDEPVLDYTAEHSYVIDFDKIIDKNELLKMFRNSFINFEEKFELRKLGTVLQNKKLKPLDETMINLDAILPLLI